MTQDHPSKTDVTLLARLRHDPTDQAAWGDFVARYGPQILRWCRRWDLQEADAEDVTQDVLLKLHGLMATFSYEASKSFRAWLKMLMHHAWRDLVAQRRRAGIGAGDSRMGAFLEGLEAGDDLATDLPMQILNVLEHVDGRDDMGSSEFLQWGPGQLVGGRACGREPSRGKAHVWYKCTGCSGSCHRVAIRPFRMLWHLAHEN